MIWERWIKGQNSLPFQRQKVEFQKCSRSVFYFIDNYCWGKDERTGAVWRLRLWPFQRWLLRVLLAVPLLLTLKGRQLGVTWLAMAYAVWLFTFHAHRYVLLFSHRETEAKELLARCKFIRDKLPEWLQVGLTTDNELEIHSVRGSRIQAFPTTGKGGRTYAASFVVVDEAGLIARLNDLITALRPTTDGGGRLWVLGTAKGLGEYFALIAQVRARVLKGWRFTFLPWFVRPDRDAAWYKAQEEEYPEKWRLMQEHPSKVEEAFQLGHRPRFETERVLALLERARDPLPADLLAREAPDELRPLILSGALQVWRRPKMGRSYLIAADTAEGLPEGDRCAAVVQDHKTGLVVADLAGWWEDHVYAGILAALGTWYRWAQLAVERNNTGHSVINSLVNVLHYPRLYRMPVQERGKRSRRGWQTSTRTKPIMYSAMAEALYDGTRRWYSAVMLGEALQCEHRDDGTVGAPETVGMYDDVLTAYCIAEAIRREKGGK